VVLDELLQHALQMPPTEDPHVAQDRMPASWAAEEAN
jgi:hypothetical protein